MSHFFSYSAQMTIFWWHPLVILIFTIEYYLKRLTVNLLLFATYPEADTPMTVCRSVVFYNSLSRDRTNVVRLHINIAKVEVQDPNGNVIASQVDPFFVDNEVSTSIFKVCQCVCYLIMICKITSCNFAVHVLICFLRR